MGGIGLLLVMLLGLLQSCSSIFGGGVSNIVASSYLSEDSDLLAAEATYCAMEDELREYLDTYEQTHDYDEYHFDLDEIKHDPYVLLSILSALHEGQFTIDQVQDDLQMLFDKQYILTETVTTETRYRTETRTDSEGNEYEVEVPYTWYICTVELENFDLSHVTRLHHGYRNALHVRRVYVHAGEPLRSVPVIRVCGQVHHEPARGL